MEENVITNKSVNFHKSATRISHFEGVCCFQFQFERLENKIRGKEKQITATDTKVNMKSEFGTAALFTDCIGINCSSLFTSCVSSGKKLM